MPQHRSQSNSRNRRNLAGHGTKVLDPIIQRTRSDKGLENHTVLRSLLETAKRQDKNAHRFLFDLFTKSTADAQAGLYRNPLPKPELRCFACRRSGIAVSEVLILPSLRDLVVMLSS